MNISITSEIRVETIPGWTRTIKFEFAEDTAKHVDNMVISSLFRAMAQEVLKAGAPKILSPEQNGDSAILRPVFKQPPVPVPPPTPKAA